MQGRQELTKQKCSKGKTNARLVSVKRPSGRGGGTRSRPDLPQFPSDQLGGKRLPSHRCLPYLVQTLIYPVDRFLGGRSSYEPHKFFDQPIEFFVEEIRWIEHHGIETREGYEGAERIGRAGSRIAKDFRKVMFEIYERYLALRSENGKDYDWDDLAAAVSAEFDIDTSPRHYKHVVIDEGQDFSPEMIRSLVKAVITDGSVTFFGDVAQQIYGQRISWRSAGLNIRSHWEFIENYRNTAQIARLALCISQMPYFKDIPDLVEPVSPSAAGPLPTIVRLSSVGEINFVVDQAVKASKTLSVALLFRDRTDEKSVSARLPNGSVRLHRNMKTWSGGPGIKYGTYHAAKGLEFDMVILPFCSNERLPDPQCMKAFGEEDGLGSSG